MRIEVVLSDSVPAASFNMPTHFIFECDSFQVNDDLCLYVIKNNRNIAYFQRNVFGYVLVREDDGAN